MWLTQASTLQKEGSQVAQFNLTSEEEGLFFEDSLPTFDIGHGYRLRWSLVGKVRLFLPMC